MRIDGVFTGLLWFIVFQHAFTLSKGSSMLRSKAMSGEHSWARVAGSLEGGSGLCVVGSSPGSGNQWSRLCDIWPL